ALPQMNALHYVDVRRGSSYYDRNLDCPDRNCIVEAINWYLKVLTSTDSPLAEKQIALNYIVHLVGDLHQPLHVGFIDELGGTKTRLLSEAKSKRYTCYGIPAYSILRKVQPERWQDGLINSSAPMSASR